MKLIEKAYEWNGLLQRREGETKYIVVHHAKAVKASPDDIHSWHLERDGGTWIGIGYHFVCCKNGLVYTGRPSWAIGAHTEGHNHESIGICFEGDFDIETPTKEQEVAGIELIRGLMERYKTAKVVRHRDLTNTACPGKNFNDKILLEGMKTMAEQKEHWAEETYRLLTEAGLKIHEKRFEDPIKRGEALALILQLFNLLKK